MKARRRLLVLRFLRLLSNDTLKISAYTVIIKEICDRHKMYGKPVKTPKVFHDIIFTLCSH